MEYRFVTPTRAGKWYPTLSLAQQQASGIGAGYYDRAGGAFYQYTQCQLQVRRPDERQTN